MKKSLSLMAVVIFASCATFRRAGQSFTDKGTAFPVEHFNSKQRAAIEAEPRLSVKEMSSEDIPNGVDTTFVDAALAAQAEAEEKALAEKAQSASKPAAKKPPVKKDAATPKKPDAEAGKTAGADAGKA